MRECAEIQSEIQTTKERTPKYSLHLKQFEVFVCCNHFTKLKFILRTVVIWLPHSVHLFLLAVNKKQKFNTFKYIKTAGLTNRNKIIDIKEKERVRE